MFFGTVWVFWLLNCERIDRDEHFQAFLILEMNYIYDAQKR